MKTARSALVAALLCTVAACAASTEPSSGDTVTAAGAALSDPSLAESALATAILDFANTASSAEIDGVVSKSAADSIVAARPLGSVSALAAVPNVGESALNALLAHVSPAAMAQGAGFWEETLLDPDEAATVLEMGNNAALGTLGCDLGFSSTMAQRIIDGRPYASLDQLVAVSYFGASQLNRLKRNIGWWQSATTSGDSYDCVSFNANEQAAALDVVNHAGKSQLCAAADPYSCTAFGWPTPVNVILGGRPWASLEDVAAASGIGPTSMGRVRFMADGVVAGWLAPREDTVSNIVLHGPIDGYMAIDTPVTVVGPTATVRKNAFISCVQIADAAGGTETATLCSDSNVLPTSGTLPGIRGRFFKDVDDTFVFFYPLRSHFLD